MTEVLMSLLIMSIGVVTLATLFPISVLRSVQATQLTKAAHLRYNAEAIIDTLPHLIHNPNQSPNPNLNGTNYIVDPLGWIAFNESSVTEINDLKNIVGNDGNPKLPNPAAQFLRRFNGRFIDLDGDGMLSAGEPDLTQRAEAARFFVLPDNWTVRYEGVIPPTGKPVLLPNPFTNRAVELSATDVTDGTLDLTQLQQDVALGARLRVCFYDDDQHLNLTRMVDPATGGSIDLATNRLIWNLNRVLPANGSFDPDRVRIETQDQRFSYLLTVRKRGSGTASVDVVVFFNRNFDDPTHEAVHNAAFLSGIWAGNDGVAGTANGGPMNDGDDDGDGTVDEADEAGFPGSDDVPMQTIDAKFNLVFGANVADPPALKKGGFVLDVANAEWYRIQDFEMAPGNFRVPIGTAPPTGTPPDVRLVLDRPIAKTGTAGVIIFPSVVEVYTISNKRP